MLVPESLMERGSNTGAGEHGRDERYRVNVHCRTQNAGTTIEIILDHVPWLDDEIELLDQIWIVRSVDFYQDPVRRSLVIDVIAEFGWPADLIA